MRRMLERCAALDVHKAQVTVCARILGVGGEIEELITEFSAMTIDLLALRDWLKQLGVTHVAMEATGVYWKCAARRPVVSPAQPGGTRRKVLGSNGLPGSER
jgi:hypothetical protein